MFAMVTIFIGLPRLCPREGRRLTDKISVANRGLAGGRPNAPYQQENDRHEYGGKYRPVVEDIDIAEQRGLIADNLADVPVRPPLGARWRSKLAEVLRQIVQRRLKGRRGLRQILNRPCLVKLRPNRW